MQSLRCGTSVGQVVSSPVLDRGAEDIEQIGLLAMQIKENRPPLQVVAHPFQHVL